MGFLGRTKRGGKGITGGEEEGKGEKGREGTYPEIQVAQECCTNTGIFYFVWEILSYHNSV